MEMFLREPKIGVRESGFGCGDGHSNCFWARKDRYTLDWLTDLSIDRSIEQSDNIECSKVPDCGCGYVVAVHE